MSQCTEKANVAWGYTLITGSNIVQDSIAAAVPCGCSAAVVAASARSMNASWRALATTSKPEDGEAAAVQRDTTWASKASWLSLPCNTCQAVQTRMWVSQPIQQRLMASVFIQQKEMGYSCRCTIIR